MMDDLTETQSETMSDSSQIAEPDWPSDGRWPDWWPDGADQALVLECARASNCSRCRALVEAMHQRNQDYSVDGEHVSLSAFSDGN